MLRCAKYSLRLRIAPQVQCGRLPISQRSFTRSRSAALALTVPDGPTTSQEILKAGEKYNEDELKRRYETLVFHLDRNSPNWNRAWKYYENLLSVAEPDEIPLELHRRVLRCCSPTPQEVRTANVRRLSARNIPVSPHLHEDRFKRVIRNIRSVGAVPDVEDYNFVLLQFAAVGHYIGAMRILKEMKQMGVEPQNRTYGLCLQTIAHRLTLPCKTFEMPRLVQDLQIFAIRVLEGLRGSGTIVTSVNLDLLLRILKYSERPDVFETVLKRWYGLDLAYPDRLSLEVSEEIDDPDALADRLIPISTSTLTTIIDYLGYKKEVSKMVTAFEVLSNPLPTPSATPGLSVFEDDDDDLTPPAPPNSSRLSHALPNINTFNTLIRHCAWNRSGDLARHYVLQALESEKESTARLQNDWLTKGKHEIEQSFIRVNKHTFIPLLGLANREKKFSHLKWLRRYIRIARGMKEDELAFFERHMQGVGDAAGEDESMDSVVENRIDLPKPAVKSTFFTPSTVSSDSKALDDHLDSGDDDFTFTTMPRFRSRTFDPKLHVSILRSQLQQMDDLRDVIESSMTRVTSRLQEKVERRISKGKDVYSFVEQKRVVINRDPSDATDVPQAEPSSDAGESSHKEDQSLSSHMEKSQS